MNTLRKSHYTKILSIPLLVALCTILYSYTSLTRQKTIQSPGVNGLVPADSLDIQVMATEPMLKNPTNISVDEKGRVWVTEAYNYRFDITKKPTNPAGDRIMLLEDTNKDGVMDKSTVFYQGPEMNAPLGICVLGKRVIVAQSPYIWAFYDDNEDGKADRKEIMFQGIGGEQHDHGAHAFTFGPDGKLYFNLGNEGKQIRDKNNNPVLDQDGDPIDEKKYRQGMVLRCDPDGSNVEVVASNFRNMFEVAVDSYGTLWQSDNDDDGNKSTRINYVMEYGKFGFNDEMSNASWRAPRTNMEKETPLLHWHQNDPGVVPNLLATGAGSPSGIMVYEGTLLPKIYQNQMIHAEPGNNVVRAYPVTNKGAGYTATIANILTDPTDQWFRPVDVCAAPDGSLIIADWYDPGVGGHQAGDLDKGRIYRIFPIGKNDYTIPVFDFNSAAGLVSALQNANLTVRYKAWVGLQALGTKAIPELEKLWKQKKADSRLRARALWALVKMPGKGSTYISQAIKDADPNIRIVGIRAARQLKLDVAGTVAKMINDADPQVKRELAIALHHNKDQNAPALWATLAAQNSGTDRWYLEALGIGADHQWDQFFKAYLKKVKDPLKDNGSKDIVWRARTDESLPYLSQLASDEKTPLENRLRYFRAFDFNTGIAKSTHLLKMLDLPNKTPDFTRLVLKHMDSKAVGSSASVQKTLKEVLPSLYGTPEYVDIIDQYKITSENPKLLQLAIEKYNMPIAGTSLAALTESGGSSLITNMLAGNDLEKSKLLLIALGSVGTRESLNLLQSVAFDTKYNLEIRKLSATAIGRSRGGRVRSQALAAAQNTPADVLEELKANAPSGPRPGAAVAANIPPPSTGKDLSSLFRELTARKANAAKGKAVFARTCFVCHQVNGAGLDFGPKLSEIGSKLPKEALLDNIVNPSNGINFGYETAEISMKDGSMVTGIVFSKTETEVDVKYPGGTTEKLKASDVKSIKELKTSLMPEGLDKTMNKQELADLLEYLSSLKKKS